VGARRTVGRRVRLCFSQAIGFSVHLRIRRSATLEPFASGLPDVNCHGLVRFECRTIDITNCQKSVKFVSFLVRAKVWTSRILQTFYKPETSPRRRFDTILPFKDRSPPNCHDPSLQP
jgi:hypothetical protein